MRSMGLDNFPSHIKDVLQVAGIGSADQLSEYLSEFPTMLEDETTDPFGPICSDEGELILSRMYDGLLPDLTGGDEDEKKFSDFIDLTKTKWSFELIETTDEVKGWDYKEIKIDKKIAGVLILLPKNLVGAIVPPTKIEFFLLVLGIQDQNFWRNFRTLIKGKVALFISDQKILKAKYVDLKETSISMFLPNYKSPDSAYAPSWEKFGEINIDTSSLLTDEKIGKILKVILRSSFKKQAPRWRFISLYRVLENGFIYAVLQEVTAKFIKNPKHTIEAAQKNLSQEKNRFYQLVQNCGLEAEFKALFAEVDAVKATNKFAKALMSIVDNEAADLKTLVSGHKKDDKITLAKYRSLRGALLAYKIRCCIVHAGDNNDRNPTIEAFDDADVLIERVLPALERAVFLYTKITSK